MATYIAVQGDTWDSIAYKTAGNEFLCDQICAANSRVLEGVVVFEGGESVLIPDGLTAEASLIRAPWG